MDEGLGWVTYISIQTDILKVRKTCPESLRCPLTPPLPGPLPKRRRTEGSGRWAQELQAAQEGRRAGAPELCGVSWRLPCPVPCRSAERQKGAGGGREGATECAGIGEPAMPPGTFLVGAAETWRVEQKTQPLPKRAEVMVGASRETKGMGSSTEELEMGMKS